MRMVFLSSIGELTRISGLNGFIGWFLVCIALALGVAALAVGA